LFSENKLAQRMAPMLQRALIIDPNVASTRLISEIMRDLMRTHIWTANSTDRALKMANNVNPDVIFVEYAAPDLDGLDFTRALRKSRYTCRKAAVVMVTGNATAAALLAARDAGVHEFLCKPFSMKGLMRRLEAVTLRPRDWVEAMSYIGPDRRRFNSGDYEGPRKRRGDVEQVSDQDRITQALKILRSAVLAANGDPEQAMRSMMAQTEDLQKIATMTANSSLAHAARDLNGYLAMLGMKSGRLDVGDLESHAGPLLQYLPPEEGLISIDAA
jgi:CheY-like chemotaxis protein